MDCSIESDRGQVTAWSTRRLSFEPQGWQVAFRNDLRATLRSLRPHAGHGLVATYAAPNEAVVDLENVLLYNVGQGCISHLLDDGASCRRVISPDERHHVNYRVAPLPADTTTPPAGRADVTWSGPMPDSAAAWWERLRPGTIVITTQPPQPFDLAVTVAGPGFSGTRLAGALSPYWTA